MEQIKQRRGWHQLRQEDRDRMEALLDAGETQKEIAKILKVDPSTISRERRRQRKDGRYDAATARHKARVKRLYSKYQGMKVEEDSDLKAHIIAELRRKRSPDEIAGRMKLKKTPFYASKNAIYKWLYSIYGWQYCCYLCTKRIRRKRQKRKTARVMIPNRKSIDLRPLGASNRTRYGHYEGDTIVAPKRVNNTNAVAIVVERKTKLLLAAKIPSLAPREMTGAVNSFAEETSMKSCALDNGIENRDHERWNVPAYFANPRSPWQKPIVENSIGLLRRWRFRKGTDWALVSERRLQGAISFLNHKYRKSLGYQSAVEVAAAHGIMKQKYHKNIPEGIAIEGGIHLKTSASQYKPPRQLWQAP
jgi:IS30 family transposase